MSYPVSQLYSLPIPNGTLTAAQYNAEFQNVYANIGKPSNCDDYSVSVAEMQLSTDPGELGSESQATSLAGEIERLRFAIKETKQAIDGTVAHWYQTPGAISLGSVANTDTFTVHAQNDAFNQTVLTLRSDTVAGAGYYFLECISDYDDTPSTRVTLDGLGNLVTLGTITTTGQLTVLDVPGVKADKLILAEAGTGVNHITIQGPDSASTTTHVLTLPGALPGSSALMLVDAAGIVSYSPVSTAADSIGAAMTATGANAVFADVSVTPSTQSNLIGVAMTLTGANAILASSTLWPSPTASISNSVAAARTRTTGTSVAAGGVAISASSGSFTTTSTTPTDVTNLSVTITTSGRPVWIGLVPSGSGPSYLGVDKSSGNTTSGYFYILRDAGSIADVEVFVNTTNNEDADVRVPPGALCIIDVPAAGTYTYKVRAEQGSGLSNTARVQECKLVAYEL